MYDTSLLNSPTLQLFSAQELPKSEGHFQWLVTLAGFHLSELFQSSLECKSNFSPYNIFLSRRLQSLTWKVFQEWFEKPGSDVHDHLVVCRAYKILISSPLQTVFNTSQVGKSEPCLLHPSCLIGWAVVTCTGQLSWAKLNIRDPRAYSPRAAGNPLQTPPIPPYTTISTCAELGQWYPHNHDNCESVSKTVWEIISNPPDFSRSLKLAHL